MSGSGGVDSETVAAQNGETVVSTIDMNIQKIIEDNISEYMQNTGAKQIGIIAMDPNNGEVLVWRVQELMIPIIRWIYRRSGI